MRRLLLALLLACNAAAAAPPPLEIEADRLTLDEAQGLSLYQGNVQARWGTLRIEAETLRLWRAEGRLLRVQAEGRPARLIRRQGEAAPPLVAEARRIDYRLPERQVTLQGEARLSQGQDRFEGPRIDYHLDEQRVEARGEGEAGGRVRVIIGPERLPETP